MKSLVPWVCLVAATASPSLFADDFRTYRLGNYTTALTSLMNQTGKNPVADYYLGKIYLYGYGELKNTQLALRYFTQSAQKGYLPSLQIMAKYALFHEKNPQKAVGWFKQAAAEGDVDAQMFMAAAYLYGIGVSKNVDTATHYYIDAAKNGNAIAQFALAENFIDSKHSSNTQLGLIWLNKSAAKGNPKAQMKLGDLYISGTLVEKDVTKGIGLLNQAAAQGYAPAMQRLGALATEQNQKEEAAQWFKKAELAANKASTSSNENKAMAEAALWLSNGKTDKLEQTGYQMNGILSAWSNPLVVGDYSCNQPPLRKIFSSQLIFKPGFNLIQPNEVSISNYYDALLSQSEEGLSNQWSYPVYPLNREVAEVVRAYSPVIEHLDLPVPYVDAHYLDYVPEASVMDLWTEGWQKQVDVMTVFYQLYNRAILGDAQAQFEIGQMFQYGIGVTQNDDSAIIFYQNAAQQQHLGAEYNLAILSLLHAKTKADYQVALDELTDAAFKGNKKSQYVLAKLLEKGVMGPEGAEYIKANPEQALSMLYLASANGYGLAEYELANRLAHQLDSGLNLDAKQYKIALIRQLYQGAADRGVSNALLPLAFYNAMDKDTNKQTEAFSVAKSQAEAGDEKAALLLGLLYDRGIGVNTDLSQAINWYKQAGKNAVSDFILGTYSAEGKGVSKDTEHSLVQLQEAAQAKFSYADFNLAVLQQQSGKDFLPHLIQAYELGNSGAGIVLADYYLADNKDSAKMKQARTIYQGLAEKGDRDAQLKLAYMDEKGLGSAPDMVAAERWYTASAQQGNPVAQYLLGQLYQVGVQGDPDYSLAKQWYQKASGTLSEAFVALGFLAETVEDQYTEALKDYEQAAAKGNLLGVYDLALMNLYGKGMPVDYQKAKDLFIEASDKGVSEAMNQLGKMYFHGLGVARDEQQALSWYKKAADAGNANALYELGLLSETGVSGDLDSASALKNYQSAADKGNEKAMLALARIYHYGLGVEKNPKIAVDLYQKLAARQNAYAQYQLATYYLQGTAGEQSPAKAKQLLQQASDNGSVQARKVLQQMGAKIQDQVSLVDPAADKAQMIAGETANLMYFKALNEWNHGNEVSSRIILQHLVTQYPDFAPAKNVYDQVNQVKVSGI